LSFVPGAPINGHLPGTAFVPAYDGISHDESRVSSLPSFPPPAPDAQSLRSSSIPAPPSVRQTVNGHHRQVSHGDIEEELFPDEHIAQINIRMQPRFYSGQQMTASFPNATEASSQESGDAKEGANGVDGQEQSGIPSLRGGAGSPQQFAQISHVSVGFPNATPAGDGSSIIYFAKDGQETHLPPPRHGQYDQTYQSLHDVAFQQRQHGVEGALEPLYSFWSDFLVDKFNVGMYQEFKTAATNDLQQGNGSGMSHLVQYYGKLLGGPIPVSERLAADMVNLLREEKGEDRALFHALRTAWRNGATNMKTIKRLGEVLTAEEKAELDKSG
jgi:hypothetical protein